MCQGGTRKEVISIHALREESDGWNVAASLANLISIHALREESDRDITNVIS